MLYVDPGSFLEPDATGAGANGAWAPTMPQCPHGECRVTRMRDAPPSRDACNGWVGWYCLGCTRPPRITTWLCPCGTPLGACDTHRPKDIPRPRHTRKRERSPALVGKRTLPEMFAEHRGHKVQRELREHRGEMSASTLLKHYKRYHVPGASSGAAPAAPQLESGVDDTVNAPIIVSDSECGTEEHKSCDAADGAQTTQPLRERKRAWRLSQERCVRRRAS